MTGPNEFLLFRTEPLPKLIEYPCSKFSSNERRIVIDKSSSSLTEIFVCFDYFETS